MTSILLGRCRSGRRWFWVAQEIDGSKSHEEWSCLYGWEDTKERAVDAARAVAKQLGATDDNQRCWERVARQRLKEINKAKRPQPAASNDKPTEYLFSHVGYISDQDGSAYSWTLAFPIIKKTPTRIYYDRRGQEWPHREGGRCSQISWGDDDVGLIDRREIEAHGFACKRGRYRGDDHELYLQPDPDWRTTG